ncbi:class I SAM-dependent rRNA methyltransferase [Anaeromyxobacter diazotrophicus]|uniref:Ribosomal RNA large subunit methyltransferase I n=1 Tax=Anaeromyxobacter diazotrophicus TaxID=2590199 RepID=A0A7I9VT41_9BACT|nr:class I SAM-dependent rRNA methyltransferase [Anaeromyxobacter diazotrophicus]GEJ59300.1 ribosomal RNA large subunit methyltransferase I [Anaeromyxobacter diazotrophicus]
MNDVVEARLTLQKDLARHLRAGHPWVFRKAVEKAPKGLAAGAVVDVVEGDRFVARGYYDPLSAIAVRILTREPAEAVDAAFWTRRVQRALALRKELVQGTTGYRLVHGEADGLPGVVADRYDRWVVLKLYSAGLTPHRGRIVEALREALGGELAGVYGRDEIPHDEEDEGSAPEGRVLWGEAPPELIAIDEHGMKMLVDVRHGQKTGTFLDQRENRLLVRGLARGRAEALNCFSYTGGFSVAAALGGARHVVSVDVDRDAIALARDNFRQNGLDPADHAFAAEDAFELLARYKREGRRFDLVVCDPPAFAKSQKAVESALAGYASLNRAALAVLAPGGLLVTASCSARVSADQFYDAVREAAFKARVDLQLVEERRQPPDHPVSPQFREGRYLKLLVYRRAA